MQRFQSFKFELRPGDEQRRQMVRNAGCCRFIFNLALAMQNQRRAEGRPELDYAALCRQLVEWRRRPDRAWLVEAPIGCLHQALKNLERAYIRFHAHQSEAPTFKKKGRSDSFRYSNPAELKLDEANCRIFLPQLGWLRYRGGRKVLGRIMNVAISSSCRKWFVSIQTVRDVAMPVAARGLAVGIDMGIVRFATLSDGKFYAPLNSFRRHEKALVTAQRVLSRKTKYSNNWRKEKYRVQRIHVRIGNARRDYLHKITSTISKGHAVVCIEDLRVSAMSQSATRNVGACGSAAAKRGLNKSILDQGWHEFRRQLEYKLRWNGGRLITVSPRNTSITCPGCGHIARENRLSQAQFKCMACGFQENADVVGAVNVLRAGHARLACAEASPAYGASGPEPTDALSQDF